MAGDWIPIRTDLATDSAVIRMASILGLEEDLIVGKLVKIWSWADKNVIDGNAPGVTFAFLERYISVTGFAQAMRDVGWLDSLEPPKVGLVFPNWDRHMSKSAKKRAQTADRVKRFRNARSVTEALHERYHRTEQNKEKEIPNARGELIGENPSTEQPTTILPEAGNWSESYPGFDEIKATAEFFAIWRKSKWLRPSDRNSIPADFMRFFRSRMAEPGWISSFSQAVDYLNKNEPYNGFFFIKDVLCDPTWVEQVLGGRFDKREQKQTKNATTSKKPIPQHLLDGSEEQNRDATSSP